MNFLTRSSILLACISLSVMPGCRNRPGNGNGGDELPADVQKAIDDVVAQLELTSQAVGGAVEGFANVDLTSDDDNFGDCPEVIFAREDNVSTFALTFEQGCESEYYENNSVSGSISIVFDRNAAAFDADFDAFTVDGRSTTGDLHVSRGEAGELRTWSGTIDISTSGVGSVVGDIVLEINVATQAITIVSASLEVTNADGITRSVEVEGIVIRPVANGSFIPQAGTVTFEVPNADDDGLDTVAITIEFDQDSPSDGTVRVTYGDVSVQNYPIGGL